MKIMDIDEEIITALKLIKDYSLEDITHCHESGWVRYRKSLNQLTLDELLILLRIVNG